jgi:hypothetical protein
LKQSAYRERKMAMMDIVTHDLRGSAYETACRDFWYAHVMSESGEHHPAGIARARTAHRLQAWQELSASLAVDGLNDDIGAQGHKDQDK